MAMNINQLVASRVFRNHPVSKKVFVTVKLLRIAKRPSILTLQIFFLLFGLFAFLRVETVDEV